MTTLDSVSPISIDYIFSFFLKYIIELFVFSSPACSKQFNSDYSTTQFFNNQSGLLWNGLCNSLVLWLVIYVLNWRLCFCSVRISTEMTGICYWCMLLRVLILRRCSYFIFRGLPGMNLSGILSPEIGKLSYLQSV